MTDGQLKDIPQRAAEYIEKHGWTQEELRDFYGVCLHGAIQECAVRNSDAEVVRAVARRKGFSEDWNDNPSRVEAEVLDALRGMTVTDEDLAEAFGPQWREIVALVRRAETLTISEARAMSADWPTPRSDVQSAAWCAAVGASGDAGRIFSRSASWDAARVTAIYSTGRVSETAASDAAGALSVRDLIGQCGFTQEHYDTLTRPWRNTIGPIHAEDQA